MGLIFQSVPIGSLQILEPDNRIAYIEKSLMLPPNVQEMIFGLKTSSYLVGLAKTHDITSENIPYIAFNVLQIAVGEKSLPQLPAMLSTQLRVANDKAQKIAQEIERDLFAPVALELNQYLVQKKKTAGSIAEKLNTQPKQNTSPQRLPYPNPLLSPPANAKGGTQGKFPRRPAAPPNILNLKDKRRGPIPPPIPR